MQDFKYISVEVYFKIFNSKNKALKPTYAQITIGDIENFSKLTNSDILQEFSDCFKSTIRQMGIDKSEVRIVSREEFLKNTDSNILKETEICK